MDNKPKPLSSFSAKAPQQRSRHETSGPVPKLPALLLLVRPRFVLRCGALLPAGSSLLSPSSRVVQRRRRHETWVHPQVPVLCAYLLIAGGQIRLVDTRPDAGYGRFPQAGERP